MNRENPTAHAFRHADKLNDCVHCGLCMMACPTYLELGTEADSPRGRIYLMQKLVAGEIELRPEVTRHFDSCLGCRACETACPSGVQYGRLLEDARAAVRTNGPRSLRTRAVHAVLGRVFAQPRVLELALAPLRGLEAIGLLRRWRRWNRWLRMLPPLRRGLSLSGRVVAARGERRAGVTLFEGCVARVMFAATNEATVRVLAHNGCEVAVPVRQGCCGALSAHSGERDAARAYARRNIDAFGAGVEPIIVNAAGCGAMLREYGDLLVDDDAYALRARAFARRVRDVSEFLDGLGLVEPTSALPLRVAYHDACHLAHGQGIRSQPRSLLRRIPGVELVDLDESEMCCGGAGSYNLTEPAMATRLGARKAQRIGATGAAVVAAGNPGCVMQIRAALDRAGIDAEVVHPIDLLDRAYGDR